MKKSRWLTVAAAAVLMAGLAPVRAEVTAEALLKVLVRKGVLTQEEANALRSEAEQEAAPAQPVVDTKALQASVEKMQKTTLTGFVQVRATSQKHASPSTRFWDRRTRVVLKNTSGLGRAVVSLDSGPTASGSGFSLMDGFYDLLLTKDKGKTAGLVLRSGQFMKPFGLEFERPTADYEFPELPSGWSALFPGYRDVGFSLSQGISADTRWDMAIVNGNGAAFKDSSNRDNDNYKDVLARVRHNVPDLGEFSLSAYQGRNRAAGSDGAVVKGDRNRYSAGLTLRNLVGGELRAEYLTAEDLTANLGAGAKLAQADAEAWYAMYIRPVSPSTSLAIRYDRWDPDTNDKYRLLGDGEVNTLGLLAQQRFGSTVTLSLAWERPQVRRYDSATKIAGSRNEDLLTFQGQYRF